MTVVVDIGCHNHPEHQGRSQDSIRQLVRRFDPDVVYGFDPHPDTAVGERRLGRARVRTFRFAAGTSHGKVPYTVRGLSSWVGSGDEQVESFDLASWLELNAPDGCVLKLNAEGAEYALLEHLLAMGAARLVSLLLVEWHEQDGWEARRDAILAAWPSPVETWE